MTARESILTGIRSALGRGPLSTHEAAAAEGYVSRHPQGPIPARACGTGTVLAKSFITMAEGVSASVLRLPDPSSILQAIQEITAAIAPNGALPSGLVAAPEPYLISLNWNDYPVLAGVRFGSARGDDRISVTMAAAGVAETGTLVFVSGPKCPSDLCFLPEIHIAVLRVSDLVGPYEAVWPRLREMAVMPATVNLVTGPSRTGDIEQTIQLGAHGPRRLHILLVG